MVRSTENTDGARDRSSSRNTAGAGAISSVIRRSSAETISAWSIASSAGRMMASRTSPRAPSASITMLRPRDEITTGGSMVATSQRV